MDMPSGMIVLWFGSIGTIPAGWFLCDGNNGTPDLRNRFVAGAGDTYVVDQTGGGNDHTHEFTGDGHVHSLQPGAAVGTGATWSSIVTSTQVTGTTEIGENIPPFHALAYIMKS